jgi:hypothetical protein
MRALVAAAAILLAGCASAYEEAGLYGGFEEKKVNETDWTLSYLGNGYTTRETVQTYWLYRASELALLNGYDGFAVLGRAQNTFEPAISSLIDEGYMGKPVLTARFRMMKNPLLDRSGVVFNAQAIRNFLHPYVTGEKCDGNVCPHVPEYLYPGFAKKMLGDSAPPLATEPAPAAAPPPPVPAAPPALVKT